MRARMDCCGTFYVCVCVCMYVCVCIHMYTYVCTHMHGLKYSIHSF